MIKKLRFVVPVLIGAAVLFYMVSGKKGPERNPPAERVRAVRVITAEAVRLVPRVTGFGSVYPGTVWNATAQVGGEVIYVHLELKKGALLSANTEIVRISPADFKLAISQAEANIRSAEAKLAELKVTKTNTADLLTIERRGLKLRSSELARKQIFFRRRTVARAALELEQRESLTQRKKVQDLENTLRLLPTQRAVQQEQIAVYRTQLDSAKLDLARTRISLPFDAKIAAVNVEEKQFVQTGGALVTADSVDVAEIEAQIPIAQFRAMVNANIPGGPPKSFTPQSFTHIVKSFGFAAIVRLRAGNEIVEWPARFARISDTIDPKTRNVGAIVAVDGAYAKAVIGHRPPLTKGMFVEIEIRTRPRDAAIVVPRASLHGSSLYVLDASNRLEIRPVSIGLIQGDLAVIDKGVEAGDRVVVSDLTPAIVGMLLAPKDDADVLARLRADAGGEAIPK